MSNPIPMIAIAALATVLGWLSAWPAIHRLRTGLADATSRLRHDALTGLLNRSGLLAVHTAAAQQPAQPIVVLLIDLDGFKDVNDEHGHDAGDQLLIDIADRIEEVAAMYGGGAARLSGDEFAVLLPLRVDQVSRIAETFLTMIAQPVTISIGGQTVTITATASVGGCWAESCDPLEEVGLRRADIAMYHAKRDGGNRFAHYEPGMVMPTGQPRRGPRLRDLRQQQRGVSA